MVVTHDEPRVEVGMMAHTTISSVSQGTRSAAFLLGTALLLTACNRDKPPTGPDRTPDREAAVAATISAASRPQWFRNAINALPPEARPVWGGCNLSGTLHTSGTPFAVGTNCRLLQVDGYPRRYVVYVPNHPNVVGGSDVPLVVMFHGSGQNGEHFYNESGWRAEADANGFIVAFPTGVDYQLTSGAISSKWHSYGLLQDINIAWRPAGFPAGAPWPASDVLFTDLVLDDVIAQANVDTLRLHATGFSNGGAFVSRLAVERSDRLASVASITSPFPQAYVPVERIPYLVGTGDRDANAIANINAALALGQLPVSSVPLDPADIFTYSALTARRDSMTATLALEPLTYSSTVNATWTLMRWVTPVAGNLSGNEAWWGIIGGVEHEYPRGLGRFLPNGVPLAQNNPGGFDAPRTFYAFFRMHPR